jgi:hypothetical protein
MADSAPERGRLLRAQATLPEGEPLLEQQSIAMELVPGKLSVALQFEDCLVQQSKKLGVDAHPVASVAWIMAARIFTRAELVQRSLVGHDASSVLSPLHHVGPGGVRTTSGRRRLPNVALTLRRYADPCVHDFGSPAMAGAGEVGRRQEGGSARASHFLAVMKFGVTRRPEDPQPAGDATVGQSGVR